MPSLSQRTDRALAALEKYQTAHVTMAQAAVVVVDSIIEGSFTVAEALTYLALHVARYRDELATLDGRAST